MQAMTTERAEAEEAVRIEVLVETGTYEGGWRFSSVAEADGERCESALLAARTLWDEAYTNTQGCQRRVTFTTYGPNYPEEGKVTARMEYRP